MQKITFCLVLLACGLLGMPVRSQFVSADVPLNNLIFERVYNMEGPKLKNISGNADASPATPFISDSAASLEFDYVYTRQWHRTTTPGGGYTSPPLITKINGFNTTPSFFFVIRSNLLVTAGFDYLHEDISVNDGTSQSFDDYTSFICADEELLHFLPHVDTARNSLFLGGNFSYTRAVTSQSAAGTGSPTGYVRPDNVGIGFNDYSLGPSLVYIRSLADWSDGTPGRIAFTLSPAYSYNYMQSPFSLGRTGVITVLGRVDYGLTRNLYLNLSATWLHRNYIGLVASDNDLALFGAGLAARLNHGSNHPVLFRLMYDYEAFVQNAEAHEVSAQIEFHF